MNDHLTLNLVCSNFKVCLGVFDQNERLSSLSLQTLGFLSTTKLNVTMVLNQLKQTERWLIDKSGKLGKSNFIDVWPRANLFVESGPKLGRFQRQMVNDSTKLTSSLLLLSSNSNSLSLAQLAALSSNYDPITNPLLIENNLDES